MPTQRRGDTSKEPIHKNQSMTDLLTDWDAAGHSIQLRKTGSKLGTVEIIVYLDSSRRVTILIVLEKPQAVQQV